MLETVLLSSKQKKISADSYHHTKLNKISAADGKLNQQIQLQDRVELAEDTLPPLTYSNSMTINGHEGGKYRLLQGLVANLLKEQSISTEIIIGDNEIKITELSQQEAQEIIADEGYFGVEQTSERIFQLATAIAGGDPTRIDAVREGVEKGFQEALDAFNGWLPDISYKTYDAVVVKLDNWAADQQK